MFAAFLSALPLISLAVAAVTYEPKVHEVTLGGASPNEISFVPNNVIAEAGDIVRFVFKQKNHTVTRSSFDEPCKASLNAIGHPIFDTGFMPVAPEKIDNFPIFDFAVQNKEPGYFYCRQTLHCGQGMVFAINPPHEGERSFDKFVENALEFGKKEQYYCKA